MCTDKCDTRSVIIETLHPSFKEDDLHEILRNACIWETLDILNRLNMTGGDRSILI